MKLSPEDRAFFRQVRDAAFQNPFLPSRHEFNRKISALPSSDEKSAQEAVRSVVGEKLAPWRSNPAKFTALATDDLETLRICHWFYLFHQHVETFDNFIQSETDSQTLQPLKCAKELMQDLTSSGLTRQESARIIGIFYQLRRAYLFIGKALTGHSPTIVNLHARLWNNVFTMNSVWYEKYLCQRLDDFSTLIFGETGSGKGAAARALGMSGFIPFDPDTGKFMDKYTLAFTPCNLSSVSSTLIESELFGHTKGAFTGATENYDGLFGSCSPHGAIFIDEIGDLDITTQVKILTILQDRKFTPVGSRKTKHFSGRIIAATNKDLDQLRNAGQFRDDLFYRLCSDVITIPTLRSRLQESEQELDLLVCHIVKKTIGDKTEEVAGELTRMIRKQLPSDYEWPGNVRELEQCVRRLMISGKYDGDRKKKGPADNWLRTAISEKMCAQELLSRYCRELYDVFGSYEEVARITDLDRRTVKKYVCGENVA